MNYDKIKKICVISLLALAPLITKAQKVLFDIFRDSSTVLVDTQAISKKLQECFNWPINRNLEIGIGKQYKVLGRSSNDPYICLENFINTLDTTSSDNLKLGLSNKSFDLLPNGTVIHGLASTDNPQDISKSYIIIDAISTTEATIAHMIMDILLGHVHDENEYSLMNSDHRELNSANTVSLTIKKIAHQNIFHYPLYIDFGKINAEYIEGNNYCDGKVKVTWNTLFRSPSLKEFIVQKSINNGISYTTIGSIPMSEGAETEEEKIHSFTDIDATVGGSYRIVCVNTNNQEEIYNPSQPVFFTPKKYNNNVISPNPTTGNITINTCSDKIGIIYSSDGKEVLKFTGNEIDLSQYPSGVYFVKIGNEAFIVTKL